MSSLISADQTLTVGELAQVLRWTLDEAFGSGVWVAGEIDSITRARSGHVYFELVERAERAAPGAPPVASLNVVLFRDDKERVNATIKRHGNAIRMEDGVSVRIQGMLDFYPQRGQLQLRMIAIDPAHTLGALAADRDALLRALAAEGTLRRNADVALEPVPLRVGIVTSLDSAAHADMLRVLAGSGFAFQVVEIHTPVQGVDAPAAIAAAVRAAVDAASDVVVLARGGGSRTDLVAFDHELVARAIAMCERPVFTGIGHETDRSVADETAHTACSTPTAAARAVVQRVEGWLEQLDTTGRRIEVCGRRALAAAESRTGSTADDVAQQARAASRRADRSLDAAARRLARTGRAATALAGRRVAAVTHRLSVAGPAAERRASSRLDRASARLSVSGRHEIRHAQRQLDAIATRVRALDPALILRRGWSMTRRDDGALVRSVRDVSPGDGIVTHLSDGTLDSTIRVRQRPSDDLSP
ncbi:MAG: exodeoxyribonuclease VII large subunit [Acidimicrobiaceae bacterium]|nr:exodeoxyribonuclease VII large subunit [Acidimicrobiaceae bacterium]MDE0517671.1 exodeoxyribonuclease VII large subunit [Acidimicrobiaceae bacterium]MXZ94502.1 exodeoxyribonuclease VII large subunit [Acidimicrobiaceae bacterium]MYF44133.1 exodeoxyribonuclease VII large subunit [Acidimicrobiaceae bacterium]